MSEAKSKSIGTKVAPVVYDTLMLVAISERRTVADMVREMIEEGLKRRAEGMAGSRGEEVMERLKKIERGVTVVAEAAAEARYFARLGAMYGMDVAHYVSQKTEIGVMPKAPDKDAKAKQMGVYESKARDFGQKYVRGEMEGK